MVSLSALEQLLSLLWTAAARIPKPPSMPGAAGGPAVLSRRPGPPLPWTGSLDRMGEGDHLLLESGWERQGPGRSVSLGWGAWLRGLPSSCTCLPSPSQQESRGHLLRSQRAELAQSGPTAGPQDVQPEGDPCEWSPQTPAPAKPPSEEMGKWGPSLSCLARTPSHLQNQPSHHFPEGRRPCRPPGCRTPLEASPSSCAAGGPALRLQGRSSQGWVTGGDPCSLPQGRGEWSQPYWSESSFLAPGRRSGQPMPLEPLAGGRRPGLRPSGQDQAHCPAERAACASPVSALGPFHGRLVRTPPAHVTPGGSVCPPQPRQCLRDLSEPQRPTSPSLG